MTPPSTYFFERYPIFKFYELNENIPAQQYAGPFEKRIKNYKISLEEKKFPMHIEIYLKINNKNRELSFPIGIIPHGEKIKQEPKLITMLRSESHEKVHDILYEMEMSDYLEESEILN